MKRTVLHLAFWTLYTLQDALLVYTWIGPLLGNISDSDLLWVSIGSATVMVIPKLIITYFILRVSFKKILRDNSKLFGIVIEILLVLILSIVVYRVLSKYVVNPYIYSEKLRNRELFEVQPILMALMDIGGVTGLAATIKLLRIQLVNKEREKNLVREKLETELKFLRNQTNPHFLFNTLNNIYGLARKKSDNTAEVVLKLSKLLRYMLYESKKYSIKTGDEIKMLEDYLNLEKIRYSEKLSITFNKEIDDESEQIAPLLLLPFVENAFKHGASENRFESFINIDLKLKKGQLCFHIENTKENGIASKVTDNIGLSNIRRQLELLYKDYDMQVLNGSLVFKVQLTVNLRSHAKI
ncbi:MAG TPA: histidine kinase [Chitinophagaceae bacterium]|nr:histidine kinase [Chitinophagaceae bacterium]